MRQRFLVDQGYTCKVVTKLAGLEHGREQQVAVFLCKFLSFYTGVEGGGVGFFLLQYLILIGLYKCSQKNLWSYHSSNYLKSFWWWVGGGWLKVTLVFCFGSKLEFCPWLVCWFVGSLVGWMVGGGCLFSIL